MGGIEGILDADVERSDQCLTILLAQASRRSGREDGIICGDARPGGVGYSRPLIQQRFTPDRRWERSSGRSLKDCRLGDRRLLLRDAL